ncbi:hypothetical protein POJ06DRAFT_251706 [Lipomyces tetrasporus]|uniref:TPR-like protein n=1 Tax=Lipomyces tetrasporus TaxID=54092 RepID=A0AAD7VSV5_9ASCO|nr:uncharacterized protein POJ06DRAFT_251706 [Lipomyces tetrasporus]KAJ8101512.1 hypothetical protein POJ06DRAFT_251706 [Lipomyces tetrasporus]
MFYDADDPETQRMRLLIAADYTDSGSEGDDNANSEFENIDDEEGVSNSHIVIERSGNLFENENEARLSNDYDGEDGIDESALDPSLRDDTAFHNHLRMAAGFKSGQSKGKKKKKRGGFGVGVREQEPSDEVKILLGQANQAYATDDLEEAERILGEVIRIDNHVYAAWKTLGEIHKQRGDIPKCLLAWISAGHLRLKDSELWSICGKLSVQIGQIDQALYCYNRAILANGQDVEAIFERGLVFKEIGNLGKALEAFKKLHDLIPDDLTVIRELASVHVLQRNIPSAANLYEDILQASQSPQPSLTSSSRRSAPPPFGWSELNILAELYGAQKEWLKAIKFIKSTARWLLQRTSERFWNDVPDDNDDEYDLNRAPLNRHFPASKRGNEAAMSGYTLPLDLRAKMAIYRLHLGHVDTALMHAGFLLAEAEKHTDEATDEDARRYADLYLDVAEALADAEQYDQALALYAPLAEIEEYATPQIVMAMGRCLHGLADFEQAEAAYQTVIASDHSNLDARIALAEVYEATGKRREALELVNVVMKLRREQERERNAVFASRGVSLEPRAELEASVVGGESVPSFIPNTEGRSAAKGPGPGTRLRSSATSAGKVRSSRSERMHAEEQAAQVVQAKLKRLKQYQDGLKSGNPVAVSEWLQTASELVDMFTNTKAFYPSDKQRVFRGFFATARRRAGKQTLHDKLQGMATRLQESLQQPVQEDEPEENATEFRGLSFDGWFSIFMQDALTLTWHEEVEDAYSVLKSAKDANVFHQDKERVRIMTLVHLACALHVRDYKTAMDTVRTFLSQQETQFSPAMYRLLLCCLPAGRAASDIFNLPGTQKYLLRHVKGMDSLVQGRPIVGSVKVKDHLSDASAVQFEKENPVLLTLYGQILAASRSHVPSLSYYMRAFAVAPQDPMVLFSIAMAHLHRAMQRQTNNRHLQIVQGLSYLIDYYRARVGSSKGKPTAWAEAQEANYNVGRAFHMLGLPTLAAKYYESALAVELPLADDDEPARTYSLQKVVAYNLQLVYVMSGNFRLARKIIDEYLVI